jgi:hypothetical protein
MLNFQDYQRKPAPVKAIKYDGSKEMAKELAFKFEHLHTAYDNQLAYNNGKTYYIVKPGSWIVISNNSNIEIYDGLAFDLLFKKSIYYENQDS